MQGRWKQESQQDYNVLVKDFIVNGIEGCIMYRSLTLR
jgi:hypothetical protein